MHPLSTLLRGRLAAWLLLRGVSYRPGIYRDQLTLLLFKDLLHKKIPIVLFRCLIEGPYSGLLFATRFRGIDVVYL